MTYKYIKIYGIVLLESNVINHFRKRYLLNIELDYFSLKKFQLV